MSTDVAERVRTIYLDNAATTQIDRQVLQAAMPYLTESFGNPGSLYGIGYEAAEAVKKARKQVADFLGAKSENIIFTSGGSEANSLAILGAGKKIYHEKGHFHVVCSAIEHHSVLAALEGMEHMCDVTYVCPDASGVVSVESVADAIRIDTELVCVMAVNNEVGSVNDVSAIADLCKREHLIFFTDCVQAAGSIQINVDEIGCDFLSISAHKIHGMKGVGALYCRDFSDLSPIIYGGRDQEFGLRGGTENVPGIVAFGAACDAAQRSLSESADYVSNIKMIFYKLLVKNLEDCGLSDIVHVNGRSPYESGKILSLSFDKIDGETLLLMLDSRGVCASAGSACNSREQVASHVLLSMGVGEEQARSTVRFSFSDKTLGDEVVDGARIVADCVRILHGGFNEPFFQ